MSFLGPSGCGKTTLLRCISGLDVQSEGTIVQAGRDLSELPVSARDFGIVFQSYALFPNLTIRDNVAYGLVSAGRSRTETDARVLELLELVGLPEQAAKFPAQLSGGQQQRVGIARSLAVGPELWFLDEPFSALDPLIRRQMQDEFLRLQRLLRKTIVFITHDIQEAFRLADRIAIMREGRIIQIGAPADILLKPVDSYVARFTEEVPLARVVTAGAVMASIPEGWDASQGHQVDAGATIETLLPRSLAGARTFVITRGGQGPVGLLTAETIAQVLANDATRRAAQ